MVNSMREWDLEFVEEWLPLYIREAVIGCPPPWDLGRPDILAWNLSNDGEFSLWSAYVAVARHQYKPNPPIFRSIWNWSGPERMKLLLWRVSKSVLLTNDEWSRRGLTMDASCPCCSASLESIPHVLRDFPVATTVWMEILHISVTDPFFRTDFCLWLQGNIGRREPEHWSTTFGVAVDVLWRSRNDMVFNHQSRDSHAMACVVHNTMVGIRRAQIMFGKSQLTRSMGDPPSNIKWTPPPSGWIKVNCDGARSEMARCAACGGILHNHEGEFRYAFSSYLGDCSVLDAKLWAILFGVRFAWARGFCQIVVESDSLLAINLPNRGCSQRHPGYGLVRQILAFRDHNPDLQWVHVLREANQVADALAKFGLSIEERSRTFDSCPSFLCLALAVDRCSVSFPRGF